MKRYALITLGVLAFAAGVLTYAYINNSTEADKQNAEQVDTSGSKDSTDIGTPKSVEKDATDKKTKQPVQDEVTRPGAYVTYSSDAVENADGTKLLFFHAPWCPQCQMVDADIKNDGVPGGVIVFKVDYDSNQALRQKYGVTLQTTFVKIDANGNLVKKYVAYNEPTFDSVKENLL